MNSDDIDRSLRRSIHQATPDLIDNLMDELGIEEHEPGVTAEPSARIVSSADALASRKPRRKRTWLKLGLSAAAVLILAIGIVSFTGADQKTFAVVGLDVNPSIEISVDDRERVLHADALNEEAELVLDQLDLDGVDLDTACYAVVGSMLVKGYLSTDTNSILVSVRSLDSLRGKEMERELSASLNAFLENSEVAVAILGQYVEDDAGLESFAAEHGISIGKAWLITKLVESGAAKLDETSLLELSTQELIFLAQQRKIESGTSIGKSDTSGFISQDKAVDIAYRDAGVNKDDAVSLQVEFDCEDGMIVYEIEFIAKAMKYEYTLDARTGNLLSSEVEPVGVSGPQAGPGGGGGSPYDDDAFDDDRDEPDEIEDELEDDRDDVHDDADDDFDDYNDDDDVAENDDHDDRDDDDDGDDDD